MRSGTEKKKNLALIRTRTPNTEEDKQTYMLTKKKSNTDFSSFSHNIFHINGSINR